jgi:radical SAM superfamily enzyme YgiQ (UPF0313 family)
MNHVIFLNGIWSTYQVETSRAIAPYQLKHWISKFGFNSQVIDFCHMLSYGQITTLLQKFISDETLAIGVPTNFLGAGKDKMSQILRFVKINYPTVKIITGGAYGSKLITNRHFAGNAEDEFLSWLFTLQGKPAPDVKFDITTCDHRFDHTDCILPDEVLPIELGRGCMFRCKFCNTPNKGRRKNTYQRKHQYIRDEIQWNKEQFGVTKYNFLDDTVNEDPVKLQNLSGLKDDLGFGIMWNGYIRADLIWSNQKTATYLMDSGMRTCYMGIETFNKAAGDAVGKGWAARHGKTFLPFLHDDLFGKQVNLFCSFIAGLPYETEESLLDTYQWCADSKIGYHCMHPLSIIAGTELADEKLTYDRIPESTIGSFDTKYNTGNNRVSGWDLFNYLGLGYDIEHVRMLTHAQLPKDDIKIRMDRFIETYVQKLSAL